MKYWTFWCMDRAIPCHHVHELQSFKTGPDFSPTLYMEAAGDDKFIIQDDTTN